MEDKKINVADEPMTMVYVCSPYRVTDAKNGTPEYDEKLKANIKRAKCACRLLSMFGYVPVAPHLYFTQFLDDATPEERELGMLLGAEMLCKCDELWTFGDKITEGMQREIAQAKASGIKVRHFKIPNFFNDVLPNTERYSDIVEMLELIVKVQLKLLRQKWQR